MTSQGKSVSTWQVDEYDEENNLFATAHVFFIGS